MRTVAILDDGPDVMRRAWAMVRRLYDAGDELEIWCCGEAWWEVMKKHGDRHKGNVPIVVSNAAWMGIPKLVAFRPACDLVIS